MFVVALATAACGDHDAPGTTPSPDRKGATSAKAASPAQAPAGEAEAAVAGPTRAQVMRRIDGRRIRVDRRRVVIDRDTLACGRAGTTRAGGRRMRIRLRCVQPTFRAGSVAGPDAIFLVHPTPRGRLVITNARFTSY